MVAKRIVDLAGSGSPVPPSLLYNLVDAMKFSDGSLEASVLLGFGSFAVSSFPSVVLVSVALISLLFLFLSMVDTPRRAEPIRPIPSPIFITPRLLMLMTMSDVSVSQLEAPAL